jgi:predicted nucleic acid-binding protein
LNLYLDASVVVALFTADEFTDRAVSLFDRERLVFVSDLAEAEFASSLSRRVRMKEMSRRNALAAFEALDEWTGTKANPVATERADVRLASTFLRRLDLPLRTMDATHIAIARRFEATLATFDARMAESARTLGVPTIYI